VHFFRFEQDGPYGTGWVSDEWEITGADVDEVQEWAGQHADGRRFVLYARHVEGNGTPGLIRLQGADPLDSRGTE
jgi:hypothetical protein